MFDKTEITQRLRNVQERVSQSGLDALVVFTDPNIAYLIGVHCELGERVAALVIPRSGEPSLIVPRLEKEQLGDNLSVSNIRVYWEKDSKSGRNWYDYLYQCLGHVKRIGIDGKTDNDISSMLGAYDWTISSIVEDLRLIKSPAEIALSRRVAYYWTQAMNNMLKIAKVDTRISDLISVGGGIAEEIFINEKHANWINTNIYQFFQCSPASSSPHHLNHRPDDRLPDGPTTLNAIGSVCDYYAENERTILVGDYTSQHSELFDITYNAHCQALDLIKPGVLCAEVDCAVQEYFSREGLSEYMRHRVGHGFGLLDQERPYLSEGSEERFLPGMLVSVEPGLYVNGVGGFRHSDTILVTDSGAEVLTSGTPISRELLTF